MTLTTGFFTPEFFRRSDLSGIADTPTVPSPTAWFAASPI
jgi:hypothetical protein